MSAAFSARLAELHAKRIELKQRIRSAAAPERATAEAALREVEAKTVAERREFQAHADAAVEEVQATVARLERAAHVTTGAGRKRLAEEARRVRAGYDTLKAKAEALRTAPSARTGSTQRRSSRSQWRRSPASTTRAAGVRKPPHRTALLDFLESLPR